MESPAADFSVIPGSVMEKVPLVAVSSSITPRCRSALPGRSNPPRNRAHGLGNIRSAHTAALIASPFPDRNTEKGQNKVTKISN